MRIRMRWLAWSIPSALLGGALVASGALPAGSAPVAAAPAQPECGWQTIGQSTSGNLFHSAVAMDTDNNKLYIYGGLNDIYAAQNTVEVIDLTSTVLSARHSRLAVGSALAVAGAAGAYRAMGAASDSSALWFFGGARDPANGQAGKDVQRYTLTTARWERPTIVNANEFKDRFLAAAAYDPKHDVIWLVGGLGNCTLPDIPSGGCPARPLPTQYLTIDPDTGALEWHDLPGGDRSLYGHSMVWDAARERMLIYGGTKNLSTGVNELWALDLSGDDPAAASFVQIATTVAVSGQAPAIYFHGAALMASRDWLVVAGGVRQNYLKSTEATESDTWALDLSASPVPVWTKVAASTVATSRVGGAMTYDPRHSAVVFALGRDRTDGNPNTPENIQRRTSGFTCESTGPVTPSPTRATATRTPTRAGTPTRTLTPTRGPSPTRTLTPTRGPSPTPTPTGGTATSTPTDTRRPSSTPTITRTPRPSATRTDTPEPSVTPTATQEPAKGAYLPMCLNGW